MTSNLNPPDGWTTDPDEMKQDYYWDQENGAGQVTASEYDINDPVPLMCTVSTSGTPLYMFASGSTIYLWNMIESVIWQVNTPGSAQDIADWIGKNGIGSLDITEAGADSEAREVV